MTDKEKIRAEIERRYRENKADGYSDVCEELWDILSFIDSMQEEPVSESINFEQELYKAFGQVKDFTLCMRIAKRFYDMGKKSREPVSENLEEAVNAYIGYAPEVDESSSTYGKRQAFKAGAQWQKEHSGKPADGDDLPKIDREVIAILGNGKVVFAHRPPEFWDGKNIVTGEVTRHYPRKYGKGGWNIPFVKYWLDVELPKEIEL